MSDRTREIVIVAAEACEQEWLAWSGGRYPDDSPGDVIHAEPDGTITLDDGVTTWNPIRALAWYAAREQQLREALREIVVWDGEVAARHGNVGVRGEEAT